MSKWLSIPVLALALTACDPYEDENRDAPRILHAFTSNAVTATEGTESGGAWTITGVPGGCATAADDEPVLWVTFNKLLNGATIQASPTVDDTQPAQSGCVPANGWLAVTGTAPPAGSAWYSCYSPGSPTETDGGSVVIYQAPVTGGSDGWADATPVAPGTYTFSGTVADKQGNQAPINVTMTSAAANCP
jgi:hypothetical protein